MKRNHHSLRYKQEKEPNKKYKDLKQKQKAKIADWMYEKPVIITVSMAKCRREKPARF